MLQFGVIVVDLRPPVPFGASGGEKSSFVTVTVIVSVVALLSEGRRINGISALSVL